MRISASARRISGFTLVELLVVITIIGTLVAILLPAVVSTRESGRRAQCINNLTNLSKAIVSYDTSKQRLPGYSQAIPRSPTQAVGIQQLTNPSRWALRSVAPTEALPISWMTVLLPLIERQDIWDQVLDVNFEPEIRPIDLAVCPSDTDAIALVDTPALSYSASAGAPDWDGDIFLADPRNPKVGDTIDNGLFLNLFEYSARRMKAPSTRLSKIRDGASTTIMLSENIHKSYEPAAANMPPRFSWAFGTEQQLGIVWVVNDRPQPGNSYVDQERINYASDDVYANNPVFDPNSPRFARPASNHPGGVVVAFADSHAEFLRDDIEYVVYQQLLTANGNKCVDPRDHDAGVNPPNTNHAIHKFRTAPPLSEKDYR